MYVLLINFVPSHKNENPSVPCRIAIIKFFRSNCSVGYRGSLSILKHVAARGNAASAQYSVAVMLKDGDIPLKPTGDVREEPVAKRRSKERSSCPSSDKSFQNHVICSNIFAFSQRVPSLNTTTQLLPEDQKERSHYTLRALSNHRYLLQESRPIAGQIHVH